MRYFADTSPRRMELFLWGSPAALNASSARPAPPRVQRFQGARAESPARRSLSAATIGEARDIICALRVLGRLPRAPRAQPAAARALQNLKINRAIPQDLRQRTDSASNGGRKMKTSLPAHPCPITKYAAFASAAVCAPFFEMADERHALSSRARSAHLPGGERGSPQQKRRCIVSFLSHATSPHMRRVGPYRE